jgi:hypothetical protein
MSSRIEVARTVAADPASVALLLSGSVDAPAWPGAAFVTGPPLRTGVGFVVDVAIRSTEFARGRLRVVAGADGPRSTQLSLTLDSTAAAVDDIRARGRQFLDGVADAAQDRSFAA